MKFPSHLLLIALVTGVALADPPRSPSPTRYKDLYLNSAFTDPPPEEEVELIPSDLPDWVLVGLSKYVDGVKVKLMNKKDRTRVTIPSAEATEMGFSIKEVKQDRNFIDEAVVTLQKGNNVGDVRFDPQYLTLKKVAAAAGGGKPGAAQPARGKGGKGPERKVPVPVPTPSSKTPPSLKNGPPPPGTVPTPAVNNQSNPGRPAASSRKPRFVPSKK